MDELAFLDAVAQAELVRMGEVKAEELVDAAVKRIELLNPKLNVLIADRFEEARAEATEHSSQGMFAGVPFLLKDLDATYRGLRQTRGTKRLKDKVPQRNSELVIRFKQAGLLVIGTTNTPELGLLPTTEPLLHGPTRNPWDKRLSPGGSSGGSAAAVSARMVPMAHGSDGAGSIRIPASCCGLFGLKPTRSRNPLKPHGSDLVLPIGVEHPITRSVRDSAAILDATHGSAPGDSYNAPPPKRQFLEEVGSEPGTLKIAFSSRPPTDSGVHPDCVAAVEDAARLCTELGHEVVEETPAVEGELFIRAFNVVWSVACASGVDDVSVSTGGTPSAEDFEPFTWALYQEGKRHKGTDYLKALRIFQEFGFNYGDFFSRYDILLTPTLAEPILPMGSFDFDPSQPLANLSRFLSFTPFTPMINLTGQPAMSVPTFWNHEGLPVGTHFVGRFGDEASLFRLAAQLEEARPWAGKSPPVTK